MTIHHRPRRQAKPLLRFTLPIEPGATPRQILEAQAALIIDLLDRMTPDPDLEENGDLEPSIGTCYQGVVDAELDKADDEPSLGSFDRMANQDHSYRQTMTTWYPGQDFEADRSESEPSLGSPFGGIGNQEHWAQGVADDREGGDEDYENELDDDGDTQDGSRTEDEANFSVVCQ